MDLTLFKMKQDEKVDVLAVSACARVYSMPCYMRKSN